MFIENVHRYADDVYSCDAPCWRDNSRIITGVKGGKVPNLLSGYTETKRMYNGTIVHFVHEKITKK
jgi:hypothetical protein